MGRKIGYWVSTVLVAAFSAFAAFAYLSGSQQAVEGFAHVGYPQQLRIILGIAKLLGAITLVVPVCPGSKSGPMPDSHSPGSRHLLRTIWPKTARKRSCR
jgi:hypothetical protein